MKPGKMFWALVLEVIAIVATAGVAHLAMLAYHSDDSVEQYWIIIGAGTPALIGLIAALLARALFDACPDSPAKTILALPCWPIAGTLALAIALIFLGA
jgi:hypothetical protein